MLEQLDAATLERLATEIPGLRRKYLIGRVLSKSQTALTRLAELRQSQLNLTTDLHTGYTLRLEIPVSKKRFSVIEHRRKLRETFNGSGAFRLHPLNGEFVERHHNMSKGIRDGIVWTLDSVDLFTGQPALEGGQMRNFLSSKRHIKTSSSSVPLKNSVNVSLKMGLKSVGMRLLMWVAILFSAG